MLFNLAYYANNDEKTKITTDKTDNNVIVDIKKVNNRQIITLKAINDIVIHQNNIKLFQEERSILLLLLSKP